MCMTSFYDLIQGESNVLSCTATYWSVLFTLLSHITVKKMTDHRNHRRFTLRCIKAGITLLSCRIRNPLKTGKIYKIIHKVERQLLYERVRNKNNILYMYEHNRAKSYSQLRNHISEDDIIKCMHLINKIKEHRHNKIKRKQIDKFEHLFNKTVDICITLAVSDTFLWADTPKTLKIQPTVFQTIPAVAQSHQLPSQQQHSQHSAQWHTIPPTKSGS